MMREQISFEQAGIVVSSYEACLTPENIDRIELYMTQGIDGLQMAYALFNVATIRHPGKPISNSLLIHELIDSNVNHRQDDVPL